VFLCVSPCTLYVFYVIIIIIIIIFYYYFLLLLLLRAFIWRKFATATHALCQQRWHSLVLIPSIVLKHRRSTAPILRPFLGPYAKLHYPVLYVGPPRSELSMGPFCVTRSNPTHQLTDPTQPNLLQVKKLGPNPTQPNTNCHWLTLSLYYSF